MAVVLLTISCGDQVVVGETHATCGNGSIKEGEACDDGIIFSDRSADAPQLEACDDGNADDADACTAGCQLATIERTDLSDASACYEQCDDGNDELGDGCVQDCRREFPGNGRVDQGSRSGQCGYCTLYVEHLGVQRHRGLIACGEGDFAKCCLLLTIAKRLGLPYLDPIVLRKRIICRLVFWL